MAKVAWIAAIGLIVLGSYARAEGTTPNVQSMYANCQASKYSTGWGICLAYVTGVGDLMELLGAKERQHPDDNYSDLAICGTATGGAMVQAFKNWAARYPQAWQSPELFGVALALRETWPCPRK